MRIGGHNALVAAIALAVVLATARPACAGIISTVAGTGVAGYNGDGIPATDANISGPWNVCLDSAGNIYIADGDNHRIRKVEALTGLISTIAGTGVAGYNGDGIPATDAAIRYPSDVCADAAGNVYFADMDNHRIRKVDAVTGLISTVAGTGVGGYNGDNIPATEAMIRYPHGVFVDPVGNIYVADSENNRIRMVDVYSGLITTLVGTGAAGYNGDDILATSASLDCPDQAVLDAAGNLYIPDSGNDRIRKVNASTGIISTIAGTGVAGYNGDGIPAIDAQLYWPDGVAIDELGNVYVVDLENNRVRKVDAVTGFISTVAGTGVRGYNGDEIPPAEAQLNWPGGIFLVSWRLYYIADGGGNRIRKVFYSAPSVPSKPAGPDTGCAGEENVYSATASDPDGDQVKYGWDWDGDLNVDEWSDFLASGTEDSRSHVWASAGTHHVRVKSEDIYGLQSDWSEVRAVSILAPPDMWDSTDDSITGAIPLFPADEAQSHGLHGLNQCDPADWYKVVVATPGVYFLTSTFTGGIAVSGGDGDVRASLYSDPAGAVLAASDEDGGGNLQFQIKFSATSTGNYYLKVEMANPESEWAGYLRYWYALPAKLEALSAATPPAALVGEQVKVTLVVTNTGGLQATNVIPALSPVIGGSLVSYLSGANPAGFVSLGPGQSGTFTWTYSVTGAGVVVFSATATGKDEGTGGNIQASSSCQLEGLSMARLNSSLAVVPSSAFAGTPVCVTLTVTNTGNLAAEGVMGQLGIETGSILVSSLFPLAPSGPVTLNAGQMQVFSWSCTVSGAGTVVFSCTSTGTEEGTGNPLFCWASGFLEARVLSPSSLAESPKGKLGKGEFLAAPNVYDFANPTNPIVFVVKGDAGGLVELGVYDESGEYIGTLKLTLDGLGEGELAWSGEAISGKRLGSGIYWVSASGAGVSGRKRFVVKSRSGR